MMSGERDIAVQAVREGYIAIAPTTRAFGETRTEEDRKADKVHSCHVQLLHGLLAGRTPIGERVWDMSRLIDCWYTLESSLRYLITEVSVGAAKCRKRNGR